MGFSTVDFGIVKWCYFWCFALFIVTYILIISMLKIYCMK